MATEIRQELLNERDAARYLGVSQVFLRKRRQEGGGPRNCPYRFASIAAPWEYIEIDLTGFCPARSSTA